MTKQTVAAKIMEDLVQQAQSQRVFSSIHPSGPGDMIQRLGPMKRELLKDLKSEDMDNVRPDSFFNI